MGEETSQCDGEANAEHQLLGLDFNFASIRVDSVR